MSQYRQVAKDIADCTQIPTSVTALYLSSCFELCSLNGAQNAPLIGVRLDCCFNLTDCSQLTSCSHLTEISICGCSRIRDFAFVGKIKTVLSVSLRENGLTELIDVRGLDKLQKLDLRSNKIQVVDARRLPQSISVLDLRSNQIKELPDLHEFSIEELGLSGNRIQEVCALCQSIKILNLSCNEGLRDFSFLQQCARLTELSLQHDKNFNDTQCHYVSFLTTLKILDISYTSISALTPLIPLSNVENLSIQECKLIDSNQLFCLVGMSKLAQIRCFGNYMCSSRQYMEVLSQSLPSSIKTVQATKGNYLDNEIRQVKQIRQKQTQKMLVSLAFGSYFYPVAEAISKCSTVSLRNCRNADLSIFSKNIFENLQGVSVEKCLHEREKTLDICNQPNLKTVFVEGCGLERTTLRNLEQLEVLALPNNKLNKQDFSFLYSLERIRVLNLAGNQITYVQFLSGMRNLEDLDLSSNKIGCIDPVKKLSQLKVLKVGRNQIENCDDFQHLANLREVDASENFIKSISLKNQVKLKILNVCNNQITNISQLSSLVNIEELDVSINKVSEPEQLQVLQLMQKIRKFSCFGNGMCSYVHVLQLLSFALPECVEKVCFQSEQNDVSVVKQHMQEHKQYNVDPFKRLLFKILDLTQQKLFQTAETVSITNCRNMNQNQFSETQFSELQRLKINKTEVLKLFIQDQPKLEHIDVQQCKCYQIKLEQLNLVTYLNLSHNRIKNIQSLINLSLLKELVLIGNEIRTISPISKLLQIETIDLSCNCITNFSQLLSLQKLNSLKRISFSSNPISRLIRKTKKLSKRQIERTRSKKQEQVTKLQAYVLPLSIKELFAFQKDKNEIEQLVKQLIKAKKGKNPFKVSINRIERVGQHEQRYEEYESQILTNNKQQLIKQQVMQKLCEQCRSQHQKTFDMGNTLRFKVQKLKTDLQKLAKIQICINEKYYNFKKIEVGMKKAVVDFVRGK